MPNYDEIQENQELPAYIATERRVQAEEYRNRLAEIERTNAAFAELAEWKANAEWIGLED
jgi:hypothetical protein